MTRRTALTAALLAGVLLAGLTVPANAVAVLLVPAHRGGNRSNLTLRVMEGSSERWEYNSPDNRRPGVWYGVFHVVATSYWGTPNDRIYVRGTFDVSSWPDPSCGTDSQPSV